MTSVSQEVSSTCVGTQFTQKFLHILSFSQKFLHILPLFLKSSYMHSSMKWCSKFPTKMIESRKISYTIAVIIVN